MQNYTPYLPTLKLIKPVFGLFVLLLILLTGCTASSSKIPMNYRWASVQGSQIQQAQAGEQFYFQIFVDEPMISEGVPVKIKVSGNVNEGSIRFELRRPDGQPVWDSGTIRRGDFSIQTEYTLPAGQTGTYTLGLVYSENTSAVYDLSWHAIQLGPAVLIPGLGMILVGVVFVLFAARRKILGWRYFWLGALFWVLTVAVKFAVAVPLNPLVIRALGAGSDNLFSPANLAVYFYIGALTGIFEAGLAWLILSRVRWGKASWNQALVFGIGFGVIEAVLLGLAGFGTSLIGLLSAETLPVATLGNLANNATLVMGLAPVAERLSVIFAHIFSCVLIFYAIASRQARWGWLAILYKTLLDTPGGFAAYWGANTAEKIWTLEAVIAMIGLLGLWATLQIARRYPLQQTVE
ncbi:YhfC family glutamic-type intramembrane protease [Bellilinea sp.]